MREFLLLAFMFGQAFAALYLREVSDLYSTALWKTLLHSESEGN